MDFDDENIRCVHAGGKPIKNKKGLALSFHKNENLHTILEEEQPTES